MSPNLQILNRAVLAGSAAVLLACALVVSNARADEQVRSETVKFQDLNVSTPEGVEALYHRIHSAAERVCSPGSDWVYPFGSRACAKDAEARAIEKVNLPQLTAYYRAKTGNQSGPLTARR
jgi:UrcA family protein